MERDEKRELIHVQVEWTEDLGAVLKNKKFVKREMKEKILKQVGDEKFSMFLTNTFYRMYLYMLKNGVKSLAVFLKEYVFVCKVDVFGKNLICVAVLEEKIDEYSGEVVDCIGGKIPDAIDYNEVYKEVWWYELRGAVRACAAVLIVVVMSFVIYRLVVPVFFPKKPKVSVKKQPRVQTNFSSEEKEQARVLALFRCLEGLKKKMIECSSKNHVRVNEMRLGTVESAQSVGCNVVVVEEYDYPAPETEKAGKYYRRESHVSSSVNREDFLKNRHVVSGVRMVGDLKKCLEAMAKLGGEVISRKGGVARIRVKTNLTPKQAALLPDFLERLTKVCGWGILNVRELDLRVHREKGTPKIELSAGFEVKERGQIR